MNITRRRFVQQATAASLAASSLDVAAIAGAEKDAKRKPMLPIIDTHQHLWDLKKFRLPWLKGAKPIAKSFVTADFLDATRGLNVVKAVYMEVDVAAEQQVAEAEHVIGLCKSKDHPTVAAVISGRPASEKFEAYIKRYKGSPHIKGVRQVLQGNATKQGFCLQDQFVRSVQLLGELSMSYDLCMRPTELADGAKLARKCPDTRFIVDHCGNGDPKAFFGPTRAIASQPSHKADPWRRDIDALAKLKNVVCKISGIVSHAPKGSWKANDLAPIINHCLSRFGPDRVMFGGDWPVCTLTASYRQWVEALKAVIAERPESEQRRLLHDNAEKFYGLA